MIAPGQPIVWRGPMRSKLLHQFLGSVDWGDLDYLVADLPPGTGDEVITLIRRMEPDLTIVVTTPQEMSLIDSRRAIGMAREMGLQRIAVVENMSGLTCPNCGEQINLFGTGGGRSQAEQLRVS
jgi:Mrp family chromosome partitioning ATPase